MGSILGVKRTAIDADHSPLASAEVRMSGAVPLPRCRSSCRGEGQLNLLVVARFQAVSTMSTNIATNRNIDCRQGNRQRLSEIYNMAI